nr:FAD-binding oxidoreductase [Bauldia sp.]
MADLPAHAGVVVIGGGIIGCSTAYHLARDHKADVVLLDRGRLTGGSTWHAAGLVGQLRSSASITQVLRYSVDLYKRLDAETGLATGWRQTGCLRLATNPERWTEFRRQATTAHSFGLDMHLLSPAEAKALWPLLEVDDLVGATFMPTDGQASPSDITQSLAKGARMQGARLFEGVAVTGFDIRDGRVAGVETSAGRIACEKVVVCAGMWSRQVAALAGVSVPLQAVKHQYVVPEAIAGVKPGMATIRDPDRRTYFKEEVGGLAFGGYEPDPIPWTDTVPDDFEFQLLEDNWDHFEQHLTAALARIPALDSVGINAAPTGSYSLTVNPDRKVSFQVWQPGWTVLTSTQPLGTKDEIIVVSRTGERVTLTFGGQSTVGTIKAPLSRDPLWIGDFPGDDSWGANYRIHPAMVGTVRVVGVAPMVATPDLVVDETGTVSAALKARITKALEGVNAQTGGRLYVLFTTAQNIDGTLAAATRLREAQQAAHPGLPLGVLSYSPSGRGYSRTNSFDAKINFEQVKAAWAATEGSLLAEHAAQQIEYLAGQRSPTTTTTPPALIGEAKIGPEGGKVASSTGDFEVSIPSGALAETQTVKVTQLNGGSHGRIVSIEAGGKLLAKPATITYRLPDNVDASTVVAAGHVTESLWSVHPSQYNPATRTLTAKTNHFSNQGWFGMNKKQHQVAGAVTYSLTGTILIHVSTTALLGSAA